MNNDINKIWKDYWDSRNDKTLLNLMNYYVDFLKTIVQEVLSEHRSANYDDLFTIGLFGLKDSIESFSPDCHVPFDIYCTNIVKQAMLNQLNHPSVPLSDYISENW